MVTPAAVLPTPLVGTSIYWVPTFIWVINGKCCKGNMGAYIHGVPVFYYHGFTVPPVNCFEQESAFKSVFIPPTIK